MAARQNRDEMVIATKFGTGWKKHLKNHVIQTNFGGLNAKNLKHSLEASLTKLRTSFVDILYVHWWDYAADIPEIMHALNDVVSQGKVLYLGISATPAWLVVSPLVEQMLKTKLTTFVIGSLQRRMSMHVRII